MNVLSALQNIIRKVQIFPRNDSGTPAFTRGRLIISLFSIYFLVTIVILFIFWLAIGSNQARFLRDKVVLKARLQGNQIASVLTPSSKNRLSENPLGSYKRVWKEIRKNKETTFQLTLVAEPFRVVRSTEPDHWKAISKNIESVKEERRKISKAFLLFETGAKDYFVSLPEVKPKLSHLFGVSDPEYINFYFPVAEKGGIKYTLIARSKAVSIFNDLGSIARIALNMVILVILLLVVLGIYLYKRLLKPIQELSAASEKIGQGDLTVQVERHGRTDDLGQLIYTFNNMVSKLRAAVEELELRDERVREELQLAGEIQKGQRRFQHDSRFMKATTYMEAFMSVTGDYVEFIQHKDGSEGILLCDVSGHGVSAGLITFIVQSKVAMLSKTVSSPALFVKKLNQELCETITSDNYVAFAYVNISKGRNLQIISGGVPDPLFFHKKTKKCETIHVRNLAFGLAEEAKFKLKRKKAQKGDRLILFTDGISEQANASKEQFGVERLEQIVTDTAKLSIEKVKEVIVQSVREFAGTDEVGDDTTFIIIELK